MPDWSIKIVQAGSGAEFVPDLYGAKPGDPLKTQQDDLVTWNNTTNDPHQPWPSDANYNPLPDAQVLPRGGPSYLSDVIPAQGSSRPSYDVAQPAGTPQPSTWTVYYCCKLHPTVASERGTIVGTVPPPGDA
ncbi:MAG TPA: hypothetical protein VJA16_00645 [Thermoanaerobaculia bacterium]